MYYPRESPDIWTVSLDIMLHQKHTRCSHFFYWYISICRSFLVFSYEVMTHLVMLVGLLTCRGSRVAILLVASCHRHWNIKLLQCGPFCPECRRNLKKVTVHTRQTCETCDSIPFYRGTCCFRWIIWSFCFLGSFSIHCSYLSQFKTRNCNSGLCYISTKMECRWKYIQTTLLPP